MSHLDSLLGPEKAEEKREEARRQHRDELAVRRARNEALEHCDALLALHQPDECGECASCCDWDTQGLGGGGVTWPCPTVLRVRQLRALVR